ncbi:MAG: hypothetical protein GXY83_18145 [Rhodopirellula sp.]|nr:hypothetical protein [Rhodopirellula sp.]
MTKRHNLTSILTLTAVGVFCCAAFNLRAETVRDRLWIWGRPAGIYNNTHFRAAGLRSTVEPVDAAEQMGIRNMTFIATENLGPLEEYYRPFERLDRVYWSLVAAGGGTTQAAREAAFTLAEKHRNIVGFILDDFFHEPSVGNAADPGPDRAFRASLTPAELRAIREQPVRGARVPLMSVIYTAQVKAGARAHLAQVDQICLWTWRPEDLKNLEANFKALEELASDKDLFLGCYMFDFHQNKPLPVSLMQKQVDLGHQLLTSGRIAGIIFLSTGTVGAGLETVDWTREWIRTHGDQTLPTAAVKADRR